MLPPPERCTPTMFPSRLPRPKFAHPPEVYQAIIQEHRSNEVRMGEYLVACGWTLADAAWACVNWDLRTVAAAIANERAKRSLRLTTLSESELAELKKQIQAEKKATTMLRPKKTTRIVHRTNRINLRPPKKPEDPPG